MIDALLSGKLSSNITEMEDLLTSSVFGALKYLDQKYLIEFLEKSITFEYKLISKELKIKNIEEIVFWPMLSSKYTKRAEPDVLITIETSSNKKALVCIEAKYNSKKSSIPDDNEIPNDQLAKEYDNLFYLSKLKSIDEIYLIYLTKDIIPPFNEMNESVNEYKSKRKKHMELYWLNWQALVPVIKDSKNLIMNDVYNYLLRLNINMFQGIPECNVNVNIKWKFFDEYIKMNWHKNYTENFYDYKYYKNH